MKMFRASVPPCPTIVVHLLQVTFKTFLHVPDKDLDKNLRNDDFRAQRAEASLVIRTCWQRHSPPVRVRGEETGRQV